MKKLIVGTMILTLAVASIPTTRANDTTWATIGKVATGVAVAGLVASAIDANASCTVAYAPACPPVVYAPAPPPVVYAPAPIVYAPRVVVAPPRVVIAPRVVCVPSPIIIRRPIVVVHRGWGCW